MKLTLALAFHPSFEPLLPAKNDLTDTLPAIAFITIRCLIGTCEHCRCPSEVEPLVS